MKDVKIILLALFTLLAAGLCLSGSSVHAEAESGMRLTSDGKGGYYVYGNGEKTYLLRRYDETGGCKEYSAEHLHIEIVLMTDGEPLLLDTSKDMLNGLLADGGGQRTVMMTHLQLKNNCAAVAGGMLYAVDRNNDTVIRFHSLRGEQQGSLDMGESVAALFTDPACGCVFALLENGVCDLSEKEYITCDRPSFPIRMNGGYCTDANGSLFSFDGEQGFVRLTETGYEALCCRGDTIYALSGRTVLRMDSDGNLTGLLELGEPAQDLAAGKRTLALLQNSSLRIVRDEDFVPAGETSRWSEESVFVSEKSDSDEASRWQENSRSTERTFPGEYQLTGDKITGIPIGTTVAAFRRNAAADGKALSFRKADGKGVSSGRLGTGYRVEYTTPSGIRREYELVVMGDLTGEGNVNTRDIKRAGEACVELCELTQTQRMAADLDGNGTVDIRDVCLLEMAYEEYNRSIPPGALIDGYWPAEYR